MLAFLTGFILGLLGAIPIGGPISVIVIDRVLAKRYRPALALAFGASIAEAAYCTLAFWGVGGLLARFPALDRVATLASAIVPAVVAVIILWSRARPRKNELARPSPQANAELHAAGGFLISAANPLLLASWSTAAAWVHGVGLLTPGHYAPVLVGLGVLAGANAWFVSIVYLLRRMRLRGLEPLRRVAPLILATLLLVVSTASFVSLLT